MCPTRRRRESRNSAEETKRGADAELDVPPGLAAMKEGDAEILFLGTGSSAPAKYRNVTGIVLDQKAKGSVFVDTGEGTLGQLVRCVGPEAADDIIRRLKCVWISHIHADHHVGLPSILARRRALTGDGAETDPIVVVGPKDLRTVSQRVQRGGAASRAVRGLSRHLGRRVGQGR